MSNDPYPVIERLADQSALIAHLTKLINQHDSAIREMWNRLADLEDVVDPLPELDAAIAAQIADVETGEKL